MTDYYAILGVSQTATEAEIKTAFRTLAKTYHPDKNPTNPNAAALFEQIIQAYNTLTNSYERKRYDYKLNHSKNSTVTTQKTGRHKYKERNTPSEAELKRRDYYKTHYKQAERKAQQQPQQTYSDYKYVLFATPLAVGLLMLVMSMFNNEPTVEKSNIVIKPKDTLIIQK